MTRALARSLIAYKPRQYLNVVVSGEPRNHQLIDAMLAHNLSPQHLATMASESILVMQQAWWHGTDQNGKTTAESARAVAGTLTCSLCNGLYREPVELGGCMHTFCKSCITEYEESGQHYCPECGTFFFRKDLAANHTLADIVEQWKRIDSSMANDARHLACKRPSGATKSAAAIPAAEGEVNIEHGVDEGKSGPRSRT